MASAPKFSEIELALAKEPSVLDCAVRARNSENGQSRIIAYVVPTPAFSEQTVRYNLQSAFPGSPLPDHYVLLSGLPFSKDGTVDEGALAQFEIVDEESAKVWEQKLLSLPGVQQAAVLIEPQVPKLKPLHISDLLPTADAFREPKTKPALSSTSEASDESPATHRRIAISHGGALRSPEQVPLTLQKTLERAAETSPSRSITYVQADGSEVIQTYAELLEDSEHILGGLRSLGLRPGNKVIFQLEHNQDFIPAFWACVLGGFIPAPISIAPTYRESNSTVQKLRNSWELLDRPVILTGLGLANSVQSVAGRLGLADFRVETVENLRTYGADHHWHESQPEDVCLILLTSGSTGLPKGVRQTHRSLIHRSAGTAEATHFDVTDVLINWFPLDHVGGIVMSHLMALFSCASHIHIPTEVILQEPLKWLDLIDRYCATVTWAPNFAFGLINDREKQLEVGHWDLSSMRFILNGGEAIVPKTARKFLQLLAKHGLRADVMHPSWGMSETCSGVAFSDRFSLESVRDEDKFVEVGAPIPGVSFRIVDGRDRALVEGQIGRLQVTGLPVTTGYYRNPELNRECFSEDGWFNTGDLGFLREARLTITGRAKDVIIVNGVNFHSHEIEAVAEEVEGVKVSFTAACPVRMGDKDTDQLAIFFHTPHEDWPSRLEVMKAIREALLRKTGVNAEFLIPLSQEEIPKTAIGKIQRSKLRERLEAGEFRSLLKQIDIESANANTLPDWFLREMWVPRKGVVRSAELGKGTYLVFVDESGLGDLLSRELRCRGSRCVQVRAGSKFAQLGPEEYCLDPRSAADYRHLLKTVVAEGGNLDHVLHLWAYGGPKAQCTNQCSLRGSQDRGTYSVLLLIQAMAQLQNLEKSVRLFVLTSNTQVTSGDETGGRPEFAPVSGLLLTAGSELPWLQCRHIDLEVDAPEANMRHVLHELEISRTKTKVAYRKSCRLEARLSRVELTKEPAKPLPIKPGGLYMITGGLGGLGTELAKYLISQHRAKLILVGRTPLLDRADGRLAPDTATKRIRNYSTMKEIGGDVRYEALDVADVDKVRKCIADAEARWDQPLAGIFHLAGLLAGSENLEQHWEAAETHVVAAEKIETFEEIFRSKVYGTWALFEAIQNRTDALFVAFSSVNALFGGASFGAYSAANAFLDSFCLVQRYRSHPLTYCFNWSMWNDLGMSEASPEYVRELARNMGYLIISKIQGIHSMLAGLSRRHPQLVIGVDGNSSQLRGQMDTEPYALAKMSAFCVANGRVLTEQDLDRLSTEDRGRRPPIYRLVSIPEMPVTEAGEIDRDKLRGMGPNARKRDETVREPNSEIEQKVAQLWKEELNLLEVNLKENFFELGGDSLTAVRLVNRLRQTFGVSLSVRTLFEMPMIPQLAAALGDKVRQQGHTGPPITEHYGRHSYQELLERIDELPNTQVDALLEGMAGNEFAK